MVPTPVRTIECFHLGGILSDIRCPKCRSKHLRRSRQLSAFERVMELFGVVHLRCRDCGERFTSGLLDLRNWLFARCPRCYRLDLTGWKKDRYIIPGSWKLLFAMGAKARRCDACRCNFVSFRPAKRWAVRRRPTPVRVPVATEPRVEAKAICQPRGAIS